MARGTTARLFVAVELPRDTATALVLWGRAALAVWGPGASPPRVLDRESLHLTLCFLGSRPFAEAGVLAGALESCGETELGELSVGAPVWLPPRRPRALAVEISDPAGALGALQRSVSEALRSLSDRQPRRERFRPHVTVIRTREAAAAAGMRLPPTPGLRFVPRRMALLRSHLDPAGARYEALASYPLGGDGG